MSEYSTEETMRSNGYTQEQIDAEHARRQSINEGESASLKAGREAEQRERDDIYKGLNLAEKVYPEYIKLINARDKEGHRRILIDILNGSIFPELSGFNTAYQAGLMKSLHDDGFKLNILKDSTKPYGTRVHEQYYHYIEVSW